MTATQELMIATVKVTCVANGKPKEIPRAALNMVVKLKEILPEILQENPEADEFFRAFVLRVRDETQQLIFGDKE
jgi:hypothetical protein